jgi:hypothetical protein
MIQAVIFLVGVLAGLSLIAAAVVAVVIVIWAQDVEAALRIVGTGYYVLVALLPIGLWLAILASHDERDYQAAYGSAWRAVLTALQGAVIGSILGAGPIFLAVVVNLPVILAGFDIETYGPSVSGLIVWSRLALALAAAAISAIPLGLWAFYQGSGQRDD